MADSTTRVTASGSPITFAGGILLTVALVAGWHAATPWVTAYTDRTDEVTAAKANYAVVSNQLISVRSKNDELSTRLILLEAWQGKQDAATTTATTLLTQHAIALQSYGEQLDQHATRFTQATERIAAHDGQFRSQGANLEAYGVAIGGLATRVGKLETAPAPTPSPTPPVPPPNPPSPQTPTSLQQAARNYAATLPASYARGVGAAKAVIAAGGTISDSQKAAQAAEQAARQAAFKATLSPFLGAVLPEGAEPATQAQRDAFGAALGQIQTGVTQP